MTERHDIGTNIEGRYWCYDEGVDANDCTDLDRCSAQCVCNPEVSPIATADGYRTLP